MGNRIEDRHGVEIQGRYRKGTGVARDVVVKDLSHRGCKFFDRYSNLDYGEAISIRIGTIGPIYGTVRWREGGYVGVRFDSALYPAVLEHMVASIKDWSPVDRP